jgi:hypothetical protein
MPNCLQNLHASGETGDDVRSMQTPDTLINICPGDFIVGNTVASCLQMGLISGTTWDTNLLTTQKAAKLLFKGIALSELDTDTCVDAPTCLPYANYVPYSKWRRTYTVVDTAGAAAPTTWVRGQGFTFGKNPDSNNLVNYTIQKTSDALAIVFKATKDSCGDTLAMAEVEFSA